MVRILMQQHSPDIVDSCVAKAGCLIRNSENIWGRKVDSAFPGKYGR